MLRYVLSNLRQNLQLFLGLSVGLSISMIATPVFISDCLSSDLLESQSYFYPEELSFFNAKYDGGDYNPNINLAGKPRKAQKMPQSLIRPRYYSTELGIRDKLFVGVLTSEETVGSRAVSINKTVSHLVDKVVFFIDASGPGRINTSLQGIVGFTDSRKILKPFHMIKYITDNHLDDYDFFFLVKDVTYLNARRLLQIIQTISVSEDVHAGNGKADEQTAFCSLDAGLLLSNSVMQKILNNLDWCVKNSFSDLDDANVGRCILHASGLECQTVVQGHEMQSVILNPWFKIESDIEKLLANSAFDTAVSVYPILDSSQMLMLHAYTSKNMLESVENKIVALRHDMLCVPSVAGLEATPWPIGNQGDSIPSTRFDVIRWDYFTRNSIYLDTDLSNRKKLAGADKADIEYILNATVKKIEAMYDGQLQFRWLVNGYRKFDPARGMDYQLDLAFRDVSAGHDVHKRFHVCKTLGKVDVIPMPYVTENTRINLLLPVELRSKHQTKKFLEHYAQVCMEKRDKTFLLLVLLYDLSKPGSAGKDDIFLDIKEMAVMLSDKYKKDGSKVAWMSVKLPTNAAKGDSLFAEPLLQFAIADLAMRKFTSDSLILLCQPNMEIRQDYLNRVRMNTILQWQIYSPVPFSEFHPDIVYTSNLDKPQELDINKNYGHYDSNSVQHLSFYAGDYIRTRKLTEDVIPPVRSDHDITVLFSLEKRLAVSYYLKNEMFRNCSASSIFDMFLCISDLHVLRAVEPGLRLRFQESNIPRLSYLSQSPKFLQDWLKSQAFNLGSRSQLAHIMLAFQENIGIKSPY